jgi:hypothetical protein
MIEGVGGLGGARHDATLQVDWYAGNTARYVLGFLP